MPPMLQTDEEQSEANLSRQAVWFLIHTVLALGSWLALMLVGYTLNPPAVPQSFILALSMLVPFLVGSIVNRFKQDEIATAVWHNSIPATARRRRPRSGFTLPA